MESKIRENVEVLNDGFTSGQVKPKQSKKTMAEKRSSFIVQVLNGDILSREFVMNNLSFSFFVIFLFILVVAKSYYGKQRSKDIVDLQTEVDAITAEYIENKAKLEEATARYRLVKALEKKGLKETVNPAKVIRIRTEEDGQ